jgi:hypothetical protein
MLDFVGHAAITDRLLAVDPLWTWEPFAVDDAGLPALDRAGNLWIRLTICGVTRIGVGDGKNAKEVIGDALRNGAMRFGVALDLWSKEDLAAFDAAAPRTDSGPTAQVATPVAGVGPESDRITTPQQKNLRRLLADYGLGGSNQRDEVLALATEVVGRPIASSTELTRGEASKLIDHLAKSLGELPQPEETS